MYTDKERLSRRVLAALRPCISQRLESVWYGCLASPDENDAEYLHDPNLYIGGELLLVFECDQRLFITWDESAGWEHHFSVQARSTTASVHNGLKYLDGAAVKLWKEHIGQPLREVRVHGVDGVPHIVELQFPSASVLVGDGHEGTFGDGDDTIVRGGDHLASLQGFEVMSVLSHRI